MLLHNSCKQSSTYFVRIRCSFHHKWSEKGSLWQTLLCLFSLSGCHLFDKVGFFFRVTAATGVKSSNIRLFCWPGALSQLAYANINRAGQWQRAPLSRLVCGEFLGWHYEQTDHHAHYLT